MSPSSVCTFVTAGIRPNALNSLHSVNQLVVSGGTHYGCYTVYGLVGSY